MSTNIKPALLSAARPWTGPSIRPLTSGGSAGPRLGASIRRDRSRNFPPELRLQSSVCQEARKWKLSDCDIFPMLYLFIFLKCHHNGEENAT